MALTCQDSSRGYLRDILDQPLALRATLVGLHRTTGLGDIPARLAQGRLRRIVLTGMGSSLHALHPLFLRLAGAGLMPVMIETSELIHHASGLLNPETLLMVVSQSGRSIEVIRLLELVDKRVPLIGVTNTADSPLALNSDQLVLTHAGTEFTVSCKTYQAALMALAWVGDLLCGTDVQSDLSELNGAAEAVARYLSGWERHVIELMTLLKGMRHLFLVGRGASLAAAETGGLITKESAHVHAEGMSSAAFRHGPLEIVGPDTMVVVFGGEARTFELNKRLAEDVRRAGGMSALVVQSEAQGPFDLPASADAILPILEILPVEMMTLALAELQGREAGAFERASKVTSAE